MRRPEGFRDEINIRDLGGYRTEDGRVVKEGCFYRSGGPYLMNDEELVLLEQLHLSAMLDLRTASQMQKHPDPVLPGVEMLRHSGVVSKGGEKIDFSSRGMSRIDEEGRNQLNALRQYYVEMPYGNDAFKVMFKAVKAGSTPLLFHCATGKDRTGVAAMLILYALGCSDAVVLADYMESCSSRKKIMEQAMEGKEEYFRLHPEARELTIMKEGVSEKIGHAVITALHERYPDLRDYFFEEYGLGEKDLEEIRNRYLKNAAV